MPADWIQFKQATMRRARDDPERAQDPSQPVEGYRPFESMPLDVLYKMFVSSEFTVQELKRLCSTSQRIRAACQNEYVWRKLYFLKVVKDPVLPTLSERDNEDRNYVDTVLMPSPEGVLWSSQIGFADTPYMLLIALAWHQYLYYEDEMVYHPRAPFAVVSTVKWYHPGGPHMELQMEAMRKGVNLRSFSGNRDLLVSMGLDPQTRHGVGGLTAVISHERCIQFMCRLMRDGYKPSKKHDPTRVHLIPALTEACIHCNAPNPTRLCGNQCGMAAYCNDECAQADWVKGHAAECKSP